MISGEVLATDPSTGRLTFADDTDTVILSLDLTTDAWKRIAPGHLIELDFPPGRFGRRGFEIDCGKGPLIEIDGRHPP